MSACPCLLFLGRTQSVFTSHNSITISLMEKTLALPFFQSSPFLLIFGFSSNLFLSPLDSSEQKLHRLPSIKTEIAEDQ